MGWIGGGCRAEIGDGLGGAMMGTWYGATNDIPPPPTFSVARYISFKTNPLIRGIMGFDGMDQWKNRRESINGRIGGATRGDRSEICGSLCGGQSSFHSIFFLLQCDANGPGNESGL